MNQRVTLATLFLSSLICASCATTGNGQINPLKKAKEVLEAGSGGQKGSGLSTTDIVAGLKAALSQGAEKSTGKLSLVDGFLKDQAVKILLPQEVRNAEKQMRALGMGRLFDQTITSLNRAAEDAAKTAAPIFLDAIKNMSIQDALGILRGGDQAATNYLKRTTTAALTAKFQPIISTSLEKVEATKYWDDLFTAYNKFSPNKVNPDLTAYVTEKAMDGIFYYVAQEEQLIRKDPAARASDILKKVFE